MSPSRRLRQSLPGAWVVVATVAMATMVMAITAAAATAMRDVALPRRGDATVVCDARKRWYAWLMTLAPAQPLNISSALGLRAGRIERRLAH